MKQEWNKEKNLKSISAFDGQRQIELKIGKTFINATGVDSKYSKQAHIYTLFR
jgi:hypothetical protein